MKNLGIVSWTACAALLLWSTPAVAGGGSESQLKGGGSESRTDELRDRTRHPSTPGTPGGVPQRSTSSQPVRANVRIAVAGIPGSTVALTNGNRVLWVGRIPGSGVLVEHVRLEAARRDALSGLRTVVLQNLPGRR